MQKLIDKKPKLTKNQNVCVNFELQTHFQALQSTVVSISEVYISLQHGINYFYKKQNYKQKMGHLDEKRLKTYLYMPFSQKLLFKVKITKRSAW